MPEKSIREMHGWELFHHSLQVKVYRLTLIGAIVLWFVSLAVGLSLYTWSLIHQYISDSFGQARNAAAIVDRWIDEEQLAKETMAIYRSLSESDRALTGTDAYRARFSHLTEEAAYKSMQTLLDQFRSSSEMSNIYFGVYDAETQALVYVCDPNASEGTGCFPGDWEPLEQKELNKFLTWNGTGKLYDIGFTKAYGLLCTAGYPLKDDQGKTTGFILADITLDNLWDGMKVFLLQYTLALLIVTNLVGFFITRRMKKKLVTPINDIAEAARQYVDDRRNGIASADHFARLSLRTGDEIENLSLVMADMERDLTEYEEHLTQMTAEKERSSTELSLAARIQADMLPSAFPPFPGRTDHDIFASMTPAREVGGDFYDFFLIDNDHLGLVMADVSGKGVPAALFMMVSKILVENYAMTGMSPARVLEAVNRQICSNNRVQMFVTVWFGILDLQSGQLTAANAGHEYPVIKKPRGKFELLKDRHGFVIGGFDNIQYEEYHILMEPGSKLFLYTDGVPEATGARQEMFGIERMIAALNDSPESSPKEILESVRSAVDRFAGDAPQFDDLTMLCIEYKGKASAGGGPAVKEISLEAKIENVQAVTDFINGELAALDCPMKAQLQIDMTIDEILSNVAQYAYPSGTGNIVIQFGFEPESRMVTLVFRDEGIPFNPLESKDPDVTLSAAERSIGGLGIYLVKKTMDDIQYSHDGTHNILTIRKNI